jgi:hypothetical protein
VSGENSLSALVHRSLCPLLLAGQSLYLLASIGNSCSACDYIAFGREYVEKILLSMHEDPKGQVISRQTDGTTKFDALPGGELAISQRLLDTFYAPEKK